MKKIIISLVILVLMSTLVLAGSVSRNMPSRIQPGATLTVTLSISGATAGKLFTLEDIIPAGLKVKEWTVTGAQESKEAIAVREKANSFGWSFTPTGGSATVEYKIDLPAAETSYSFGKIVWFDPSGQGSESNAASLTVAAVKCGDGVCEGNENSDNCVQDCPKPAAPVAPAQPQPTPTTPSAKPLSNTSLAWIIVAVIVVIAAVGYFMMQRKKSKY